MKSGLAFLLVLTFAVVAPEMTVASANEGYNLSAVHLIENLDSNSRVILLDAAYVAGFSRDELSNLIFSANIKQLSVEADLDEKVELTAKKREFIFLVGVGVGLVDHFGFTATVLRRNREGRLTWFAESDVETLQARFGYAPDDLRIGIGIHPFRKPLLRVALKITRSSYSDKIGVGPQLTFSPLPVSTSRIAFNIRVGATSYLGEPNARGRSYSIIPDLKFGISVRLFRLSKEGN